MAASDAVATHRRTSGRRAPGEIYTAWRSQLSIVDMGIVLLWVPGLSYPITDVGSHSFCRTPIVRRGCRRWEIEFPRTSRTVDALGHRGKCGTCQREQCSSPIGLACWTCRSFDAGCSAQRRIASRVRSIDVRRCNRSRVFLKAARFAETPARNLATSNGVVAGRNTPRKVPRFVSANTASPDGPAVSVRTQNHERTIGPAFFAHFLADLPVDCGCQSLTSTSRLASVELAVTGQTFEHRSGAVSTAVGGFFGLHLQTCGGEAGEGSMLVVLFADQPTASGGQQS